MDGTGSDGRCRRRRRKLCMPLTRSRRWRRECGAEGAESRARIAAAGEERGSSGPEASAAAVALTITSPRESHRRPESRRPDRRHSHQQLTTTIATTAAATAASAVAAALTATAITSTAHAASASSATSFPAADLAAATSAALAAASRR
jgi:hypothetical protein